MVGRSCRLRRRLPTAFTLIEMLVVVTIIGILIMLMMPAVQMARESARKTSCSNHLKQLGLAALQHVEKQGYYPSGGWGWYWVGDPSRGFGKRQPGGWVYNSLPYMDQTALHEFPPGATGTDADEEAFVIALVHTPLSLMNCPSRRRSILYGNPYNGTSVAYSRNKGSLVQNPSNSNAVARGDYAANVGNNGKTDERMAGPATLNAGDDPAATCWASQSSFDGVCFERSEVRPEMIVDGTSNTLWVGEKWLNADYYYDGKDWWDNENMYTGMNNDNYRTVGFPPMKEYAGYDNAGQSHYAYFGGNHAGGCNFVFCDGHVRSVQYTVDAATFDYLGRRADHMTIDPSKM